ncbi:hypothetical protein [Aquimarina pacifica]|uniref:hypothetical protein n=1 Tax=Aquimarina pacifica TaxID=1296415 RepID=UPI000472F552|nr:hypothetical protein [Aquimarina pacifica]
MQKKSFIHRAIALFLIFTVLLPVFTSVNQVWANNNGPNAPEAASFEPVDAKDMVSLLTGDFTYVLPVMNVPSPEGGYPIALSYHGGIPMDLQSSWVGLGWNLNPGAINRSINGYADDYNHAKIENYFYDTGETSVSYNVSFGWGAGAYSIGIGYSWGSHQSSAGYISVGYGPVQAQFGTGQYGSSIGIGYAFSGGLSLGATLSSNGKVRGNIGYSFDSNGAGYKVGASSDGTYSMSVSDTDGGISMGTTFSSEGVGLTVGVSREITDFKGKTYTGTTTVGIGPNDFSNKTLTQGDYTTNQRRSGVNLVIPTNVGVFSFGYSKQKVTYFAGKDTNTLITGPVNFGEVIDSDRYYLVFCQRWHSAPWKRKQILRSYATLEEAEEAIPSIEDDCFSGNCYECELQVVISGEAFMDTYEIPLEDGGNFAKDFHIQQNNPAFPAYDKYNVQAQGLSGSIHPTLVDNGRLFGLSKDTEDFEVKYLFDGLQTDEGELSSDFSFRKRPEFYFDNEISTYLATPKAKFLSANLVLSAETLKDVFLTLSGNELTTNRFAKSNHIAYATNGELLDDNAQENFLAVSTTLDRSTLPQNGIGAYKVTAADGKTYHYSLPVYNHETVSRSFGMVRQRPEECESYLEKRQLEPYATHWLLTAVTGPDFVDNGDGIAGDGDLGYWVNFDYGLWSDAFVWSAHPDEPYVESESTSRIKTWTKGRKQLYYLDKITTRTHTALFIKRQVKSNPSLEWEYVSVPHNGSRQFCSDYTEKFTIPTHNRLKLERILLLKNEDLNLEKDGGTDISGEVTVAFNDSDKGEYEARYHLNHNVYDNTDDWESLQPHALKEVVLSQSNRLSNEQLTLDAVTFNGKRGANLLPPYRFSYIEDDQYVYDKEDANNWGYYKENPKLWSMDEITTPQGAQIKVGYEPHDFRSVISHEYTYRIEDYELRGDLTFDFEVDDVFDIQVGNILQIECDFQINIEMTSWVWDEEVGGYDVYYSYDHVEYTGDVTVEEVISSGDSRMVTVRLNGAPTVTENRGGAVSMLNELDQHVIEEEANASAQSKQILIFNTESNDNFLSAQAGIRAKSITITDGIDEFVSEYTYGENEDGIGWVTYVPFAPFADEDVPYSSELPPSRPMYEYVTLTSKDANNNNTGKMVYEFNVLTNKAEDHIQFDDFYELSINRSESASNTSGKSVYIDEYEIEDNLNSIGQLLSVSSYNSEEQLLSKLSNEYYDRDELPESMGVVQESYQTYKQISYHEGEYEGEVHWKVNSSTRVKYPNLLKSSTELKGGVAYTTTYGDFDPISGQAKEVTSTSSLGLAMKTVSTPAFYKYPDMGSKADGVDNKNMVSQATQTLSYFKEYDSNIWQLYGAAVDTWKNWGNDIWRKHQAYTWKGALNTNGSYKDFIAFDWSTGNQVEEWSKLSEVTKYSEYSKALEVADINGNKVATKLGDNYAKVIATADAAFDKMFYTGFEYSGDFKNTNRSGGITLTEGIIVSGTAHTGNQSFRASEEGEAIVTEVDGYGSYKASVWVHNSNYENTVVYVHTFGKDGGYTFNYNPNEVIEAGDWVQLNFDVTTIMSTKISLYSTSGTTYFDDFRLHPVDASMTSYVYNEWDELTHILGSNNMGTQYEYDDASRLHKMYTEVAKNASTNGGFKLINKTDYNYKNQ